MGRYFGADSCPARSPDALINNASIAVLKTLPELSLADYNRQMLVNMTSVFLGTQKAVAIMRDRV